MSSVRRIFAEKKEAFAGQAHDLAHELRSYLGLKALERVRILIRYDIENLPQEVYLRARDTVFSEKRISPGKAVIRSSRWSIFPDSLTRGQIPPFSACACWMRMLNP